MTTESKVADRQLRRRAESPGADGRTMRPRSTRPPARSTRTAPVSGPADVDAAMAAAAAAFETWRDTTPARAAAGAAADRRRDRGAGRGARRRRVRATPASRSQLTLDEEIPPVVDQIRFFAGAARMLEGRSAGEYMAGHTSYVRREPIGVCAQVTPWNYPLMMAVWKFAPALAAGNTVVLKPSDTTPVSTLLMAEIAAEFLPPGVFNVVCGDRDTGRALVAHPTPADGVDHRLGPGRHGGRRPRPRDDLKRVHLELGGKAPVVVFDDADLEAGGRGHRRRRLLQRRPGLHRRDPGAGRAADPRRLRRRAGRAGPRHHDRRRRTTRTRSTAR